MHGEADGGKRQRSRPSHATKALLPELIEIVAKFLPTSSDMFKLLTAIPARYLTQALTTLGELMLAINPKDNELYNAWCCPIQLNRSLWPELPITCMQCYADGIAAIEKCFGLYSSITINPLSDCLRLVKSTAKVTIHKVQSYAALDRVVAIKWVSTLTLDVECIMHSIHDQKKLNQQWKNVVSLPKLEKLTLIISASSTLHCMDIIAMVKASRTLRELHLMTEYWGVDEDQFPWTSGFIQDLAQVSKNVIALTLQNLVLPSATFCENFKDCSEWLIKQKPEMLKFSGGNLSGFTLMTTDITKLIECIHGKNLNEFRISCHGSDSNLLKPMGTLLRVLSEMKSLRKLSISGFLLNGSCCEFLAGIIPRLEKLWLFNNDLADDCGCILALAISKSTRLQRLTLVDQMISDTSAIAIANSITQGSSLRTLDLCCNRIGNAGAIALSKVIPRLDCIDLTRNEIGCDGAIAISKVICQASHTSITLDSNPLTNNGTKAIISALKLCNHRLSSVKMRNVIEPPLTDIENIPSSVNVFNSLPSKRCCDLRCYTDDDYNIDADESDDDEND